MEQQIAYTIDDRLYLSITDRCTLECAFCPKQDDDYRLHEYDLRMQFRPSTADIIAAIGEHPENYAQIVFCGYGEPTLRLNVLLQVAEYIKGRGGVVRINTDGLANKFHKRNVLPEMKGLVDSLSISLNAQNETVYNQHCQPQLAGSWEALLEFIKQAPTYIPDVQVSAIDGLEGVDISACQSLVESLGAKFKYRELDKLG